MCLAIPMKLVERTDAEGVVELESVRRKVSLLLLPEAKVGSYLLIHAGYAINEINEDEAEETLELLGELAEAAKNSE